MNCRGFLILVALVGFSATAEAQPTIDSVGNSLVHKGVFSIHGSEFGIKSPAAPVHWHDLEDKGNEVDVPGAPSSDFVDAWPSHRNCGDWRMMYKNSESNRSVAPPHNRSSIIAGGGHKDTFELGNEYCSNVMISFVAPQPQDTWYLLWYERYSEDFPRQAPPGEIYFNQKAGSIGTGDHAYGGEECQVYGLLTREPGADTDFCPARCPIYGGNNCDDAQRVVADITQDWRHLEVRIDRHNGIAMWGGDNRWSINVNASSAAGPFWNFAPKNYAIGGFLRWYGGGSPYHGSDNAWRYFDDMYVDNTLARVMLANHPDYDQATVIEPQIPSSWSESSITVQANLGKLPDSGTVYLFVFDAENNHNAQGYPIDLGGAEDSAAPDAPTTLRLL